MEKTSQLEILINAKGVQKKGNPMYAVSIHLDETGYLVRTSERIAGHWIMVDESYVLNIDFAYTFQQYLIQNLRGISLN